MTTVPASRHRDRKMALRIRSRWRLLGLPLYDIALGPDLGRGEAKGPGERNHRHW